MYKYLIAAFCLIAGCQITCIAQTVIYKTKPLLEDYGISSAWIRSDPRLSAKIHVSTGKLTIRRALTLVAAQSHISIESHTSDGSGDEEIVIKADSITVHELLNGIWSAMSYKNAPWQWNRSNKNGSYQYTLSYTKASRDLRARLRAEIFEKFLIDLQKLYDAVDGSTEQRNAAVREMFAMDVEDNFERYNATNLERLWIDIRSMRDCMPINEIKETLEGDGDLEIPFDRVPKESREYYEKVNKEFLNKTSIPHSALYNPGTLFLTSTTIFGLPNIKAYTVNSSIGHTVLGSSPNRIKQYWEKLRNSWIMDSDSPVSSLEKRLFELARTSKETPNTGEITPADPYSDDPDWIRTLCRRLDELCSKSHLNIVLRLPTEEDKNLIHTIGGITLKDYLDLNWNYRIMYKWFGNLLILSSRNWPFEDGPVPLKVINEIEKSSKRNEFLPFDLLAKLSDTLTTNQILRMGTTIPAHRAVANCRGHLALFHSRPDLMRAATSPAGLLITSNIARDIRRYFPSNIRRIITSGAVATYKVINLLQPNGAGPIRRLEFRLEDAAGKTIWSNWFVDMPCP